MFATDHAPHPAETKTRGFAASANGITGLETAVAITYRVIVEEEGMPVEDWARAWWEMPRDLIGARRVEAMNLPPTAVETGKNGNSIFRIPDRSPATALMTRWNSIAGRLSGCRAVSGNW